MIKLEQINLDDLKNILSWNEGNTPEDLLQWAGSRYKHPLTKEQLEKYFIDEVNIENSTIYLYKIILNNKDIIGTIQLKIADKKNKIGWISRVLIGEEEKRGKGFGTIATKEVLRIAFDELDLENVGLGVFDFNYPAIKCYKKVGFNIVKFVDKARKAPGGYWNLYEMYISRVQWLLEEKKDMLLDRIWKI